MFGKSLIKKISDSKILVVGLVRNCETTIENEFNIIDRAFSEAKTLSWLVIESDSDDATVTALQRLKTKKHIDFISLGALTPIYPKRTERIAKCRNHYLNELRNNKKYSDYDFIVVADLDGVNSELTKSAVQSCWEIGTKWDACFANQSTAYYDIFALRHKIWCPTDCFETRDFLMKHGTSKFNARQAAVLSRMIKIKTDEEPIEVESAFGGLGIYTRSSLILAEYHGLTSKGEEICEHVNLHTQMRQNGSKLYIVPSLINCGWTNHSKNIQLKVRIRRRLQYGLAVCADFFTKKLSKNR
jgi:hypothetical protein